MSELPRRSFLKHAAIGSAWIGGVDSAWASRSAGEPPPQISFRTEPGKVVLLVDGTPVATYVYEDETIRRPYFAHVRAPGGVQVTRNHPPVPGRDPTDHADCHPGLWMSFKDISGSCYWRSEARVVQETLAEAPAGGPGRGAFAVRNRYLAENDEKRTVCQEVCRYTFLVRPAGYLLIWDSTFQSDSGFYFGDAEEMGLAVRVATPISVKQGGTILDASGRRNEREVWGNSADWCDYSGIIDGRRAGVTLMPDPKNFRPSWYHARDYGVLVANPFGREAFRKGPASKVVVKPGESFRLRFGVLLHAGPKGVEPDLRAAYADFVSEL